MVKKITIQGGTGKNGKKEPVDRVEFKMGNIVSIVGHTGSGKTTLIDDIELFANGDTPSKRRILINDQLPPVEYRYDPSKNPIALITQHTSFLSDLPVREFLSIHARIRGASAADEAKLIKETLDFANQLTGEPVLLDSRMTELSGGQTRALLIADATILCNTPIVLLDEVENAGIHRTRALELLRRHKKIFIFVTHDPRIALLSDFRVIMKGGAITKVMYTDKEEAAYAVRVGKLDDLLCDLRNRIRDGESIHPNKMEVTL
ncbi:MAG TPA: ATP-binding cassette domain-containing protein [Elusimicrobiales bacterium]|nr:ATP-binding cassette domain-containing protein [Elusimicrobiales bacterium]